MTYTNEMMGFEPFTMALIGAALYKGGKSGYEYYQSRKTLDTAQKNMVQYKIAQAQTAYSAAFKAPEKTNSEKLVPILSAAAAGLIGIYLLAKA